MRVLSIRQPWAYLICKGYKDIENRSWRLPGSFIIPQRIYVHAGKSKSEISERVLVAVLEKLDAQQSKDFLVDYNKLTFGAIIGEVDIVGCVEQSDSHWFAGKYGFVLKNHLLYENPISCLGRLGFFSPQELKR